MIVENNIAIPTSDGSELRANIYRPKAEGHYPVVMAFGIYGKDIHFEDGYTAQWKKLLQTYPELCSCGSTGRYLRWEITDPERWVPYGYVVIAVDARGSGQSPGYLDIYSPRETQDYYECIEWAGVQPWSNGKVGLLGISYLATKQWQVAALRPPHLAAIVPWEGAADFYRDSQRHGGILSSTFYTDWWPRQALVNQNGNAATTHRNRATDEITTGKPVAPALLPGNRLDYPVAVRQHPLDDAWFGERSAHCERIQVPVLSAANWGGPGNHLRGNFEGYMAAGSAQKWLFAHSGTHFESFYLPHYVAIQRRFFDHFLQGRDNGWDREPPVQLAIRDAQGRAQMRAEHEWPLARTQWRKFYLEARTATLAMRAPRGHAARAYETQGEGVDFLCHPFEEDTEFTGPVALKLWVSSSTTDLDLFAVLRLLDAQGRELFLTGAHERVPVAMGWLRASHRKTDPKRSTPWRPYHTHDEIQKLEPDDVYEVDIEILPTSMVYPKGSRLVLTIRGKDFVVDAPGRILHNDPQDRPAHEFGGTCTIFTGGDKKSHLLMPVIPRLASAPPPPEE